MNLSIAFFALGMGVNGIAQQLPASPQEHPSYFIDFEATAVWPMNDIHVTLKGQGDPDRASISVLKKTIDLARTYGDVSGEGIGLLLLGNVYSIYTPDKAIDCYRQAMPLLAQSNQPRFLSEAMTGIAEVYHSIDQPQVSIHYLKQAVKCYEVLRMRGDGSTWTHKALRNAYVNLGQSQYEARQVPEAYASLKHAMEFRWVENRRIENVLRASALTTLGLICTQVGRLNEAGVAIESALRIAKPQTGLVEEMDRMREHQAHTRALIAYGGLQQALGDHRQAIQTYRKALSNCPLMVATGYEKFYGDDLEARVSTNINIGFSTLELGEPLQALTAFTAGLKALPEKGHDRRRALLLNGIAYAQLGLLEKRPDSVESERWKNDSIQYRKQVGEALRLAREAATRAGDNLLLAAIQSNEGRLAAYDGDWESAVVFLSASVQAAKEQESPLLIAESSARLAQAWIKQDRKALAIVALKVAVNSVQSLRREMTSFDQATQIAFVKSAESAYRLLASLLLEDSRFAEAEQVLGMLRQYEEFSFLQRAISEDAFLRTLEVEGREKKWWDTWLSIGPEKMALLAERESLGMKPANSLTQEERERLKVLDAQAEAMRGAVNAALQIIDLSIEQYREDQAEEERQRVRSAKEIFSIASTLIDLDREGDSLRPIAVYPVVLDEMVVLFFAGNESTAFVQVSVQKSELNRMIVQFRETLSDPGADPRPSGKKLYDLIFKPMIDVAGSRPILWSPDSGLQYVPLGAVWDGERYLIERMVDLRFSMNSHEVLAKKSGRGESVTAFASGKKSPNFSALPGVYDEVEQVTGAMAGLKHIDEGFTDVVLRNTLRQGLSDVIHLATHFKVAKSITQSALVIGARETTEEELQLETLGRELRVDEIMSWGSTILSRTDLLVLSACSTDVDSEQKETLDGREVGSMATTAMRLGAKSVVSSLWDVADTSTSAFMGEFYRQYATGLNKADAMRAAQRAILDGKVRPADTDPVWKRSTSVRKPRNVAHERYVPREGESPWAHPYFWAPFILHGNWW